MHSYKPVFQKISYKEIKITLHAKQRAYERLGITKEVEIQKLAHSAKYNGVRIHELTLDNYTKFNISYDMYRYLKNHYGCRFKTEKMYYYKDCVFIFAGKGSKSLKSIVPCTQADMLAAIAILDDKHKNKEK